MSPVVSSSAFFGLGACWTISKSPVASVENSFVVSSSSPPPGRAGSGRGAARGAGAAGRACAGDGRAEAGATDAPGRGTPGRGTPLAGGTDGVGFGAADFAEGAIEAPGFDPGGGTAEGRAAPAGMRAPGGPPTTGREGGATDARALAGGTDRGPGGTETGALLAAGGTDALAAGFAGDPAAGSGLLVDRSGVPAGNGASSVG